MLHKNKSNRHKQWKYVLLFPLLAAFVLTFNTKVVAQEKKEQKEQAKQKEIVEVKEIKEWHAVKEDIDEQEAHALKLVITAEATDKKLDEVKAKFKKEADITLNFKGIKRNEDGAITAIKIDAKGDNVSSKFANTGDKPIKPVYIAYNSEANSLNIGNMTEKSKNTFVYSVKEDGAKGKNIIYKGKPDKKGNYVFFGDKDKDKKVTWTTKGDKKENVEVIVLDSDGKKEKVWISKADGDKDVEVHEIEVVEKDGVVKIIEKGEGKPAKILIREIKKGQEGKGENIFITVEGKDGEGHSIFKKKKGEMLFIGDDMEKALIFIDGKESSHEELKKIEKDGIEKIEVLKGDGAVEKYGEKAKNGVILVTTKK